MIDRPWKTQPTWNRRHTKTSFTRCTAKTRTIWRKSTLCSKPPNARTTSPLFSMHHKQNSSMHRNRPTPHISHNNRLQATSFGENVMQRFAHCLCTDISLNASENVRKNAVYDDSIRVYAEDIMSARITRNIRNWMIPLVSRLKLKIQMCAGSIGNGPVRKLIYWILHSGLKLQCRCVFIFSRIKD